MENKVNKILKSITPTKKEQLASQRKVKLSLVDDLREAIDELDNMSDIYTEARNRDASLQSEVETALDALYKLKPEMKDHHQEVMDNYQDLLNAYEEVERLKAEAEDLAEQLGVDIQEVDDAQTALEFGLEALSFAEKDYDPSNAEFLENL